MPNTPTPLTALLTRFIADSDGYRDMPVPPDAATQRKALRALMNIRMPRPMDAATLALQDEYLAQRAQERGVVDAAALPTVRQQYASAHPAADRVCLWQGDITRLAADAIVNAANSQMLGCFVPLHSCIDNCVHTYAGIQLRAECARQMAALRAEHGPDYEQPTAVPMLTDGYALPAKKVIHIVGPIVEGSLTPAHERALAACYENTLALCRAHNLNSVAFCCISTGVFRFPAERAAEIAVDTVARALAAAPAPARVIFNVFRDEDLRIYEDLLKR